MRTPPPPWSRPGLLLVLWGAASGAELAPTADLGALPLVEPRNWLFFNFAPDDQAVSAQAPRRRELVAGMARPILPEYGLALQGEAVWSPVRELMRAPEVSPQLRVDEILLGAGPALERPMGAGRIAWRLSATVGVRILTDLGSSSLDRGEHRLFYGGSYDSEGAKEEVNRVDGVVAARWLARLRLCEADPLRKEPLELAFDARALGILPHDGQDSRGRPDWRVSSLLVMPTRTTAGWLGLVWQQSSQPSNAAALATAAEAETGWWFASGGALRLGEEGDWQIEVGSALDLHSGVAVGTLGLVGSADPPRAGSDGTSTLEAVLIPGRRLASGVATGDELTRRGPAIIRSELRTLIGDRREFAGATTDAVRIDLSARGQVPLRIMPNLALGPEAALGLGVRRDAAAFAGNGYESNLRIEGCADAGVALRFATGWKGGVAAVEGSLGFAAWATPWGADTLSHDGVEVELDRNGFAPMARFGLLARF